MLLNPDIEADKKIPASHFLNLELGLSRPSIAPGNWHRGPRIIPDNRFKRKLHRDIEMGRQNGAAAVDNAFAIGFKGVGRVIDYN